MLQEQLEKAEKVLIGLGEEWRFDPETGDERKKERLKQAYEQLYAQIKEKDYFIVTMDRSGLIYETSLGNKQETVYSGEKEALETMSCSADEATMALLDQYFPKQEMPDDTRDKRIVCPCAEDGTMALQWEKYNKWLGKTLGKQTLLLELGVGFSDPSVIRFPFERMTYFNRKGFLYRVHGKFPQITEELKERSYGVAGNSVDWICGL